MCCVKKKKKERVISQSFSLHLLTEYLLSLFYLLPWEFCHWLKRLLHSFFLRRISECGCRGKAKKHKPFSSSKKAVMIKYVKEHAERERDFGCMLFQDQPKLNFLRSDGRYSRKPEGEYRPDVAKSTQKCQTTALVTQSTVHIGILDASLKKQTKKRFSWWWSKDRTVPFPGWNVFKDVCYTIIQPCKNSSLKKSLIPANISWKLYFAVYGSWLKCRPEHRAGIASLK